MGISVVGKLFFANVGQRISHLQDLVLTSCTFLSEQQVQALQKDNRMIISLIHFQIQETERIIYWVVR